VEGQEALVKKREGIHNPANARHHTVATFDEDVIFRVCKDTSWGIVGIAEDQKAGAPYDPGFGPEAKQKK
jgi:hypothetical protein